MVYKCDFGHFHLLIENDRNIKKEMRFASMVRIEPNFKKENEH